MNATTLTVPLGSRHLSWYAPLLLPVVPLFGAAYQTHAGDQYLFLLGAVAMGFLGILYSVGFGAWLDRAPRLIRKEVEQLRPAWLLGLFGAQVGLLLQEGNDMAWVLTIPVLLFALLASLSLGIEFQQRTLPALLSAPVERRRIWNVKMGVLAGGLLSQVLVLALAGLTAQGRVSTQFVVLIGFALAFAFAAWATVPWWTLVTRNLLAGLVFAVAVPPLTLVLIASLVDWLSSPFAMGSTASTIVLLVLGGGYLLGAPWFARKLWLALEAPDLAERELNWPFFTRRPTTATRRLTRGTWLRSLIGKELRLQSITLVTLAAGGLVTVAKPFVPQTVVSQELAALFIGLFAVVAVILAGSTAIAEERRLGTLDGQVLLPVSRAVQWTLKLLVGLAITGVAVLLILRLVPAAQRNLGVLIQLSALPVLFVFCFLASSASKNSLSALLLGLTFTAILFTIFYGLVEFGMTDRYFRASAQLNDLIANPEPWLAKARALSESEVHDLRKPVVHQYLGILQTGGYGLAAVPFLLALAFSFRNFSHPAAASRSLRLQYPSCVLATLISAATFIGGALWIQHRSVAQEVLRLAREEIELTDRLSPAELQLRQALRGERFGHTPERLTIRRRLPAGGRQPDSNTNPPVPPSPRSGTRPPGNPNTLRWSIETVVVPLDRESRAAIILDGAIPEDLREALRQEAIALGDPDLPAGPGRPPGPWPEDQPTGAFQMSPELMKRYGLTPPTQETNEPRSAGPAGL